MDVNEDETHGVPRTSCHWCRRIRGCRTGGWNPSPRRNRIPGLTLLPIHGTVKTGHCATDPSMIRDRSENDPTQKTQTATRRATEATFRTRQEQILLKITTFPAPAIIPNFTTCCACHEKWHMNFTKCCACHEKWHEVTHDYNYYYYYYSYYYYYYYYSCYYWLLLLLTTTYYYYY